MSAPFSRFFGSKLVPCSVLCRRLSADGGPAQTHLSAIFQRTVSMLGKDDERKSRLLGTSLRLTPVVIAVSVPANTRMLLGPTDWSTAGTAVREGWVVYTGSNPVLMATPIAQA